MSQRTLGDPAPSLEFDGWRIYIYPALQMHQQNPRGALSRNITHPKCRNGIYVDIKRPSLISDEVSREELLLICQAAGPGCSHDLSMRHEA